MRDHGHDFHDTADHGTAEPFKPWPSVAAVVLGLTFNGLLGSAPLVLLLVAGTLALGAITALATNDPYR